MKLLSTTIIGVFIAVFFLFVVYFPSSHAALAPGACDVETPQCTFGYNGLLSFWDPLDSNIAQYNTSMPYHVCCNYNGTAPTWNTNYCYHGPFFAAYDTWNTHIAQNRTASYGAPFNLCVTSNDGYAHCEYLTNGSSGSVNETCVGSIDPAWRANTHFGACNQLGINIWCSFNDTVSLPGIQIAQFEYWCGVADGVCPERFVNASGVAPSCAIRPDPDC